MEPNWFQGTLAKVWPRRESVSLWIIWSDGTCYQSTERGDLEEKRDLREPAKEQGLENKE